MRWDFPEPMEFNSVRKRNHPIDYGFVGDVKSVNVCITNFAFNGITLVFAITHDKNGQLLNADTLPVN
jgi:acetylglutamate kinase